MGARLWHHAAPWFPDPNDALLALQTRCLEEAFDLPTFLRQQHEATREVVERTEAENDPYELLDMYRRKLAVIGAAQAQGVPADPRARLDLVRKLHMDTGEGIGSVLDVKAASDQGRFLCAQVLAREEIMRLVGADRPSQAQAEAALASINEELERGEAVCFPFFADGETPAGWYFVGNTID